MAGVVGKLAQRCWWLQQGTVSLVFSCISATNVQIFLGDLYSLDTGK